MIKTKANASDHVRPSQELHVATVYDVNGVRFLTAALSVEELWSNLVGYVQQNAIKLWDHDEARVRNLLEAGREQKAVREYLNAIGKRWDGEKLHVEAVVIGRPQ